MTIKGVLESVSKCFCKEPQPSLEARRGSLTMTRFCSSLRSMTNCCEGQGGLSFLESLKGKLAQARDWLRGGFSYLKGKSSERARKETVLNTALDFERNLLSCASLCSALALDVHCSYGGSDFTQRLEAFSPFSPDDIQGRFLALKGEMASFLETDWSKRHLPQTDVVLKLEVYGEGRLLGPDSQPLYHRAISSFRVTNASGYRGLDGVVCNAHSDLTREELDKLRGV